MVAKLLKSIYQDYKNKEVREEKRCFFDDSNQYVLFSGTALGENGDIRHLNDLYFFLFLLIYFKVDKSQITLVVDLDIINEFKATSGYEHIAERIEKNIGAIIDVTSFEQSFKRKKNKDLIFVASGHGSIDGLYVGKNKTFITSDYFEDNATYTNRTIMIMTQCYAGAFHHLDTRKNICVLGASEYQESLSLPIDKLLTEKLHSKELQEFVLNTLSFSSRIPINPFMFSLFTALINIERMKTKKHFINIYKSAATFTLQYLKHTEHTLGVSRVDKELLDGKTKITFDSSKLIQQPYLLNKIIAARLYVCK